VASDSDRAAAATGSGGNKLWCQRAAVTSIGGNRVAVASIVGNKQWRRPAVAVTSSGGNQQQWQKALVETGIGNVEL
jgi:hypothetical protein